MRGGLANKQYPSTAFRQQEYSFSQLSNTRHDESDEDDDDDDGVDDDPIVEQQEVAHDGTVNRLRLMPKIGGHH